jgi:hypothetical protein
MGRHFMTYQYDQDQVFIMGNNHKNIICFDNRDGSLARTDMDLQEGDYFENNHTGVKVGNTIIMMGDNYVHLLSLDDHDSDIIKI